MAKKLPNIVATAEKPFSETSDKAKTGVIRARVEPELKAEAEGILQQLGLTASEAIRLFYRQITLREGLPFEVRLPNETTRKALLDADEGKDLTRYNNVAEMFTNLGF